MENNKRDRIEELKGEIHEIDREERELEERKRHDEREVKNIERDERFTIVVNKVDFPNQSRFITGKHVLVLAGKDDGKNGVAILRGGGEEDIPVELDEEVDLRDERNRRFKTYPTKSTEGA